MERVMKFDMYHGYAKKLSHNAECSEQKLVVEKLIAVKAILNFKFDIYVCASVSCTHILTHVEESNQEWLISKHCTYAIPYGLIEFFSYTCK